MYGKPEHRPRITDYQYVMALVQSGGLAVYGRFLHCPLFRAICGAWAEVPSWAALRRPQGGFHSTSSDRTPLARMLPRVIGGPAWDSWSCAHASEGYRVRLGGRKSGTGQVRLSPLAMARGGSAGEPKAAALFGQASCLKTHADGSAARHGAACPHLARAVFGAILGMGPPWPLSAKAAVIADMVWRRQLTQAV
jgi:hypothetical protein